MVGRYAKSARAGRFNLWKAIWLEAEYTFDKSLEPGLTRKEWWDSLAMSPEDFTAAWDRLME